MASLYDIMNCYRKATGLRVETKKQSQAITIAQDPMCNYLCELIGPLYDMENPDVRLFLQHRTLGDEETVTVLVQDATDDAWLNDGAFGAEQYMAWKIFYMDGRVSGNSIPRPPQPRL